MTPDTEDEAAEEELTEEEKPEALKDLESLDAAVGALEEDGADADGEPLEEAERILNKIHEAAVEEGEDGTEGDEFIVDGRDSVRSILDGEGDEEDVEQATEAIAAVGQQLQMAMLEQALGI